MYSVGYMVTGSRDTCLKRWKIKSVEDALSKKEDMSSTSLVCSNTEKAHDKDINYVCVSVNGKLIASASQDKTAKVRFNLPKFGLSCCMLCFLR